MSPQASSATLAQSSTEFPQVFVDFVASEPFLAIFVALGALFVTAAVAVLGYLTLGAVLDVFSVETPQAERREAR